MSIVELPPGAQLMLPRMWYAQTTAPGYVGTTTLIDASGEKCAFIFEAPKTGTIDTAEFATRALTLNASSVVRVSFQDVDPATGDPDGVQDQFRDLSPNPTANSWYSTTGLITSDGTNGGVKKSVTVGDLMALVFEFQTFNASDSIAWAAMSGQAANANFPYVDLNTGTWAKNTHYPIVALKYDDGNYYIPAGCMPASALNTTSFNSGSSPTERGLLFQVPWNCRLCGVVNIVDWDGDADIVLYDSGGSVLMSVSKDKDVRTSTSAQPFLKQFGTTYDLQANTDYYLMIKPTSATNLSVYDFDVNSASLRANLITTKWYYASKTAGVLSGTTTKVPFLGLLLNGFEGGGGQAIMSVIKRGNTVMKM